MTEITDSDAATTGSGHNRLNAQPAVTMVGPELHDNPETVLPSKRHQYTPRVLADIQVVLRSGGSRAAAIQFAGISKNTFYHWMREISEFRGLVEKAEAECRVFVETQLWKNIRAGSGPDIRFFLKTRYRSDWGVCEKTNAAAMSVVFNHAEAVKKARLRVYERMGRRLPGA